MKLYVVFWVDLDNDCVKKSEIKFIGVFNNKHDAHCLKTDYDHKGYSEDSRCYYTEIDELELNEIPKDVQKYLQKK